MHLKYLRVFLKFLLGTTTIFRSQEFGEANSSPSTAVFCLEMRLRLCLLTLVLVL